MPLLLIQCDSKYIFVTWTVEVRFSACTLSFSGFSALNTQEEVAGDTKILQSVSHASLPHSTV